MNGIERLKVLASEVKDEALLEIVNYLISREDMNEKYLNEEKSLKQMIEYIRKKAQKKAQNNMAMIKDEVVFGWAIHYFDESNEDLGLDSKKVEIPQAKEPQKEITSAKPLQTSANISIKKSKSKNYVPEGQLSLF